MALGLQDGARRGNLNIGTILRMTRYIPFYSLNLKCYNSFMSESEEESRRQQAEWKAPESPRDSGEFQHDLEAVAQSSFTEWCKLNSVNSDQSLEGLTISEKEKVYDSVFREGQRRLMLELSDPNGEIKLADKLDLPKLKSELEELKRKGDATAVSEREIQIARMFQDAISKYPYQQETAHLAEIINKKEMNCVGASVLGGALLDEVGIKYLVGHIGNHVLLVTVATDGRVFWQDMQDGLERPGLENEELTAEKIDGATPSDITAFTNQPTKEGLKFFVEKEYWKEQPMTLTAPNVGLELRELISTGFVLGNNGRNDEAIEILEIAKLKAPNDADVHQGLARAYKNKGLYEKAIAAYKKAVELEPTDSYLQEELEKTKSLTR